MAPLNTKSPFGGAPKTGGQDGGPTGGPNGGESGGKSFLVTIVLGTTEWLGVTRFVR